MRATFNRAWMTLCDGRPIGAVAARIVVALGMLGMLWICACAFLLMEARPC